MSWLPLPCGWRLEVGAMPRHFLGASHSILDDLLLVSVFPPPYKLTNTITLIYTPHHSFLQLKYTHHHPIINHTIKFKTFNPEKWCNLQRIFRHFQDYLFLSI
ncbi:hypothetical protein QVD17_27447 [Tagetes erecta]|uniref:Uncharacterized protein n=1 Tax=Tagetes erecta TaxID=13708 RepID=A0AAD8K949_TARER|nr:hypothetical protein QVD17_27447 [Tagetes erecta]